MLGPSGDPYYDISGDHAHAKWLGVPGYAYDYVSPPKNINDPAKIYQVPIPSGTSPLYRRPGKLNVPN